MKVVNANRKDWVLRLHDALWAYQIAFKTILRMSPYRLVFGKACHLPMKIEYKAWWEIKILNFDMQRAGLKRFLDLNELEEMRNEAYMNSKFSKDKLKRWHNQIVLKKEFQEGQKVLLYDSKLYIFSRKLKSRWNGPYLVHKAYSNGVVEIANPKSGCIFKVNGHRLKPYMEPMVQENEELYLLEPSINIGLELPLGFSISEFPISRHPNQRNVIRSSLDKGKSKMHVVVLSPIAKAHVPIPVTKSTLPSSMLNTEMVARALNIHLTPPNPTEFQPITQNKTAKMV
ncbi:hypothetical protein AAG906_011101 [Vitis piasezkii]